MYVVAEDLLTMFVLHWTGNSKIVSASMCYLEAFGSWVVGLRMAWGTFCFLCDRVGISIRLGGNDRLAWQGGFGRICWLFGTGNLTKW